MKFHSALKNNITQTQSDIQKDPFVYSLLSKLYISTKTLTVSTETRFLAFIILYRYLHHYYLKKQQQQQQQQQNDDDFHKNKSYNHVQKRKEQHEHLGKITAAALFLACKLSNDHRRIRDVINVYHMMQFHTCSCTPTILEENQTQSQNYQQNRQHQDQIQHCTIEIQCITNPPALDEKYWQLKEEIVSIEHHLLRVLNFDINDMMMTPYRVIITLLEQIRIMIQNGERIGNHDTNYNNRKDTQQNMKNMTRHHHSTCSDKDRDDIIWKNILKHSCKRINDSLFDVNALSLKVSELACGALKLAIEHEIQQIDLLVVKEKEMNQADEDCDQQQNTIRCNDHKQELQLVLNKYAWWEWVHVEEREMDNAKEKLVEATNKLLNFSSISER